MKELSALKQLSFLAILQIDFLNANSLRPYRKRLNPLVIGVCAILGIMLQLAEVNPKVANLVIGIGIVLSFITTGFWWLVLTYSGLF